MVLVASVSNVEQRFTPRAGFILFCSIAATLEQASDGLHGGFEAQTAG